MRYDGSVRNDMGDIVQFLYGEDLFPAGRKAVRVPWDEPGSNPITKWGTTL